MGLVISKRSVARVRESLFESGGEIGQEGGRYARVAVERSIDRIDDDATLTYRIESPEPAVGERVEVPLGKGGKTVHGIVVRTGGSDLLGGFDASRVKMVKRATGAKLPGELLTLAIWMSEYYVCPLGMVLGTMMPSAVKTAAGLKRVEWVELGGADAGGEAPKLKLGSRRRWEQVQSLPSSAFPMRLKELGTRLEMRSLAGLRALVGEGLLVITMREEDVGAPGWTGPEVEGGMGTRGVTPTPQQTRAIEGVVGGVGGALGGLEGRGFGVHLLHGVTGSGKTEVYLRVIDRVLKAGRRAIVLVPEISLTPQTAGRFVSRFGSERVAVLHSGLGPAQRRREWARAAGGGASVVVGARSALFAPVENLGLIVVDEEHDGSYKQDQLPRYHGRDLAIKRGQIAGCPVLLGSATPSMESWLHARSGKYRLWELPARVGGAALPEVEVVSIAEERRRRAAEWPTDQRAHLMGPTLERALEMTLRDEGQAILLLNRRGLAQYVWCRNAACGFVMTCDHCDASLVVHRSKDVPSGSLVKCHHCEASQRVPGVCPVCRSKLALFGWGTQRAEDEIEAKFGSMGIKRGETLLRLDSDEMRSARDFHSALGRFASGEVRVLVGTQMLAKGLDYPNVRLVGVLDADTSLNVPDFRAAERTFQLVSQVAGRAGRGTMPGRVIVQTLRPLEPAIAMAAAHDYRGFAEVELAARERAGLPPFVRMARIVCRDESHEKARSAAGVLAERLRAQPGVQVVGPMVPVLSRLSNQYRFAIELRSPRSGVLQAALQAVRGEGLLKSDAHTAVDVDPVALL